MKMNKNRYFQKPVFGVDGLFINTCFLFGVKGVEKLSKKTLMCSCCGRELHESNFYASYSYIHKYTKRLSICKECVWDYVEVGENDYNLEKMKDILQMIDRPFLHNVFESSVKEANKDKDNPKNVFKVYMKNLMMNHYRHLRWKDSSFVSDDNEIEIDQDEYLQEITDEIKQYWGRGYEDWEYQFLENERYKIMASFECPDYGMEMIIKDICFINLAIEKARQKGASSNLNEITKLIESRSKLMNDAKMKPIQATGADENDQITFGTLIKKWENEEPIPPHMDDEMKWYIDTAMVGHLAKMEGLNNSFVQKYEEALKEYTINFNDLKNKNIEVENDVL